ncbi:MAG TPA: sigma-70 family RNA polymerase sigma factor [Actinocrinis sp.]|nr:sigma-70 family RNA polymerase sigma factor [Actinocrinis sp.]HXR71355.1 sigma-70 family RNA polymerase sigma factor [Actinocrinis sp.]
MRCNNSLAWGDAGAFVVRTTPCRRVPGAGQGRGQLRSGSRHRLPRLRDPGHPDRGGSLHPRAQPLAEALVAAGVYSITSLDRPARGEPAQASLVEFIGAEDPRIESVIDRTAVKPLIASLDDRDRQILLMRYFQDMTQREIGARLGYSQMHVSRLLAAIFARLRGALS